MGLLVLGALFIILWYIFGGLRSPFGKALLIFSIIFLIWLIVALLSALG
jgi:hypothetical protein